MTKYLISFPSDAMVLTDEEFAIVAADAHAVIEEAKVAGVYVFGGGIEEEVHPVLVAADGTVSTETYPVSKSRAASRSSSCPTARRRRNGLGRSPPRAAARRSCGSSCTTRRARTPTRLVTELAGSRVLRRARDVPTGRAR